MQLQVKYNPDTNYAAIDYTNGERHEGHAPFILDSLRSGVKQHSTTIATLTAAKDEKAQAITALETKMAEAQLDALGALLVFTEAEKGLPGNRAFLPWLPYGAFNNTDATRIGAGHYRATLGASPQVFPAVSTERRRLIVQFILTANNAKVTDPIPEKSTWAKPQQPKTPLKEGIKLSDPVSRNVWRWTRIGSTDKFVLVLVRDYRNTPTAVPITHAGIDALSVKTLEELNEALKGYNQLSITTEQ